MENAEKMKKIFEKTRHLLESEELGLVRTSDNSKMLVVNGEGMFPLHQSSMILRKNFYDKYKMFLNSNQLQTLIEYLEIQPLTDDTVFDTACRIYNSGDLMAYELDKDTGECLVITAEEIYMGLVENVYFKHSADFQNQVTPDFEDVSPEDIFHYVHIHFNLKNKRQEKLLILYLVTAFWGMKINHPLLVLTGEKGSSKSTTMRKLEKLIDPKTSDLCGIPKGSDGLELRLANTYFLSLDNLSTISRHVSDIIARAVTGGSVTKRALYHNTKEIVLHIKAMVAMNGVTLITRESDLLDRSLILELNRISAKEIKSEQELWDSFEEDRPKILGCIFRILEHALFDDEPIHVNEKIRLADFHVACIKVGRVLGMTDEEVSELLWENQSKVNRHSIDEDIVACCIIELMKNKKKYVSSMTELLGELNEIALRNSIVGSTLPKTPNHLSNRLSKVKSNLQAEYNITYNIANVGAFKQITIENHGKVCESCERKTHRKRK